MASSLNAKQRSAIERAKNNPDLLRILFSKASGVEWFTPFREAGFLDPAAIPSPIEAEKKGYVSIPHWAATDYLVATSPELSEPANNEYAVAFLEFIRAATAEAHKRQFSNYRVWWQFSKVLKNVPPNLLSVSDVQLIDYWLADPYETGITADTIADFLVDLLNRADEHARQLALAVFKVLFKVQQVSGKDGTKEKATFRFSPWHTRQIVKKVAFKAGETLGPPSLDFLRETTEELLTRSDSDRWSYIWRPAIENHEQNKSADDTDDILVEALRDSLLGYVSKVHHSADQYLATLLESKFDTLGRIAIYVINREFEYCAALVPNVVIQRRFTNNFRHELWHLLRNRYPWFPEHTKRKVQEIVDGLTEKNDRGQEQARLTAYHRAIWLSAIEGFGEALSSEYKKCLEIIQAPPEHPDFASYMSSGWVTAESPLSVDDLLSLSVPAVIRALTEHRESGGFLEPGKEGLAKALRAVVKKEPLRFQDELQRFLGVDRTYVHEVIGAYRELVDEKAQLPWAEIWDRLLAFCDDLANSDTYWANASTSGKDSTVVTHGWVSAAIARLIESGTSEGTQAIPGPIIQRAAKVLGSLLRREQPTKFTANSDAVSIAINSTRGRCLEALIKLAYFACRLEYARRKRFEQSWGAFEPYFDEELLRADQGECEFVTIAGTHLPLFVTLSHRWTFDNFRRIFNQQNELQWRCAMEGYSYAGTVHPDIYKELKKGGDFLRALDDEHLSKRTEERFVQNIAIAYVNDFETITESDSLMLGLIERRSATELKRLVWFLWTLRSGADEKLRTKIFALWPRINEIIDVNTKQGRQIASGLCDWIAFIQRVDAENKKLILFVAPYADEDHNSYDMLVQIARISEHQPAEAFEIWSAVLKGSRADFPDEAIRDALKNLVRSGEEGKRNAKEIASIYLRKGNETANKELQKILAEA